MPSSISSSEPVGAGARGPSASEWRRFVVMALGTAAGLGLAVFAFVAVVDPWNALPLSPRWARAPMSANQRLTYAGLARSPAFDSVVVGSSTTRLLRPQMLNHIYDGRFANLSMNSETPYEETRILDLFRRTHAKVGTVVIGMNVAYCRKDVAREGPFAFPEWLYGDDPWSGYRHLYDFGTVRDAFVEAAYLLGLRRAAFGPDGYANFLPDDKLYDPARAAARLAPPPSAPHAEDDLRDDPASVFPALDDLAAMLGGWPEGTRKIVLFPPHYLGERPFPGTPAAAELTACKYRVAALARSVPGTRVIDFLIDSPITRKPDNYWDSQHYRQPIAERLMADLAVAEREGPRSTSDDFRLLVP